MIETLAAANLPTTPHNIAIIDIDGTLCDSRVADAVWDEHPHEIAYTLFHELASASPSFIHGCAHVARARNSGHLPVALTSRPELYRAMTADWLERHVRYPLSGPIMRPVGGSGVDTLETWQGNSVTFKQSVLNELRKLGHTVVTAIDDDEKILAMWRANGVPNVIDAKVWW